jgi:hypothetical protein
LVGKRRCEREGIAEIKRENLGDLIAEKEGRKFWEEKREIGDREKRGKPGRKRETREEKKRGVLDSHMKIFSPRSNRDIGEFGLQLGFIFLLSLTLFYPL